MRGAGGPTATRRPRVAVLCNPRSGEVKRERDDIRAAARRVGDGPYREASEPTGISRVVEEALEAESDVLCVVGGDGTVHAVLSALVQRAPGEEWPRLAVVPAGTANMLARGLGARGGAVARLVALRGWRDEGGSGGRVVRRPALRIGHGDSPASAGMFFGAASIAAGVRYFERRIQGKGLAVERLSALAVARVALGLAFGGMKGEAVREVQSRVDGEPVGADRCVLCLATTLDRLLLGTRPYWGEEEAPVHFTRVDEGARGFWWNLPRLAGGRPGRSMTPERGWFSRNVHRVELTFDGVFVIDGELYRARSASGPVRIGVTRVVEWLVP